MILRPGAASRLLSVLAAALLGALALAVALGGCGGESSAGADGTIAAAPAPAGESEPSQPQSESLPSSERCRAQLGGFLGSMQALRQNLAVGFAYEQYVEEVEAIRGGYEKVPVKKLGVDCLLSAGAPGEKAFSKYIAAANEWGECIEESGCDSAEVEPVLQHEWKLAAAHLDEARAGLGEPGPEPGGESKPAAGSS